MQKKFRAKSEVKMMHTLAERIPQVARFRQEVRMLFMNGVNLY
jgi:hypothetical protein